MNYAQLCDFMAKLLLPSQDSEKNKKNKEISPKTMLTMDGQVTQKKIITFKNSKCHKCGRK